jgi:hypothetical protein
MSYVTVGLKHPNGIIMKVGTTEVVLNGYNKNVIHTQDPTGYTEGVPEDLWNKWLEQNKNHPLHTGGFIFVDKSTNKVKAEAVEKKGVKTGTEAIIPDDVKNKVTTASNQ